MSYELADGSLSTDYKIGDKFKVIEGYACFQNGSIVSFYEDDQTEQPNFLLISGGTIFENCGGNPGGYTYWDGLVAYKEE